MTDAKLNPMRRLLGEWTGSGQSPQGPFEVRADFQERGRWILLRHQISRPGIPEPFYYSTQMFGYDDSGLTLDYFDTAGSFHFRGDSAEDSLSFSWKNDDPQGSDVWKASKYDFVGADKMNFSYQSCERQHGQDSEIMEFTGGMSRA
jgi:hypothetical protein